MTYPELGSAQFWQDLADNPAALAREVCAVSIVDLDDTLQKHPALRAWVGASYEAARIELERRAWEVTKTRSLALIAVNEDATGRDGKKSKTVGVMEAEVNARADVMEAEEGRLAQAEVVGALRAMTIALEDRKDMLVQLAAKQRLEMRDHYTGPTT